MTKRKKQQERLDIDSLKSFLQKEVKGVDIEFGTERYNAEGDVQPIKTGNPWLDLVTGIGGLPKGKIVEVSGEEGVSKSALNQTIAGVIQHGGVIRPFRKNYTEEEMAENAGNVVWIDAERAVDLRIPKQRKHFSERLGIDIDNLIIVQPDTIEQGLDIAKACIDSGSVDFIVYDSIVASSTEDDFDKDNQDSTWNKLPQAINRGLRNLAPDLSRTDCTLVLLNQLRQNMNKKNKFDKEWVTTGGKGLKHWCTLRLELTKAGKIKDDEKLEIGHRVRVKIIKTRLDINNGDAFVYWYHDNGYNYGEEMFELAIEYGIITAPSNGWYEFDIEVEGGEEHGKMRRAEIIELLNSDEGLYNNTYEVVKKYFDSDVEYEEEEYESDEDDDDEEEYDVEDDE